jgi:hypothetical protein
MALSRFVGGLILGDARLFRAWVCGFGCVPSGMGPCRAQGGCRYPRLESREGCALSCQVPHDYRVRSPVEPRRLPVRLPEGVRVLLARRLSPDCGGLPSTRSSSSIVSPFVVVGDSPQLKTRSKCFRGKIELPCMSFLFRLTISPSSHGFAVAPFQGSGKPARPSPFSVSPSPDHPTAHRSDRATARPYHRACPATAQSHRASPAHRVRSVTNTPSPRDEATRPPAATVPLLRAPMRCFTKPACLWHQQCRGGWEGSKRNSYGNPDGCDRRMSPGESCRGQGREEVGLTTRCR